ncbi:YncE family protein [Kaarinaea lacus]
MKDIRPSTVLCSLKTLGSAILLSLACTQAFAEKLFPESVYVSLRESNQVAKYPGQTIWKGGPKMLYNSITPDGKTLVVSSPKDGGIYIFDAQSGKQLGMVKTDKAAKGLKITPDGKEVFVSNEAANSVSVVDLASKKVVANIKTDKMPHNVRFTKDGKTAYVTLQGGAGLGVIDVKERKITKVIPTPGIDTPHNLDLSKDEKLAFIRDTSNKVGVLDLGSGKIKTIIEAGQGHAGIDVIPNGKLVFTGAIADDVVTVIDANSLKVVKKIKVGFGPHGVRASKDNKYLYASVTADDKVYVIDIDKLEVVKEFKVESFPFWVAVNGNP